jgi:hypothetical protein
MGETEDASAATRELLLSELSNFEESIWRSEDTGEKRFNFFITLVTAAAAGLVALSSADTLNREVEKALPTINLIASATLLAFGLVTYLRMYHRDRVTEEYKLTTRYVRDQYHKIFLEGAAASLKEFKVPLGRETSALESFLEDKGRLGAGLLKLLKGGYTVSLAVLNGVLLVVTLMLANVTDLAAAGGGLLLAALLVFVAPGPAKK